MGRRRRAIVDALPGMRVVALSDARGVPDAGVARECPDLQALLDTGIDALFVCATPAVAAAATRAALERGIHVFCEKPPARNVQELLAVLDVEARRPRLKLQYGFNHRRHGSVRRAREIVDAGSLGRLVSLRGIYGKSSVAEAPDSWRARPEEAGGGILLDQGIHLLDLIILFGGRFDEVHAFVDARTHGLEVEDNVWALLRGEAGVVAMLHSSATEWRHRFSLELGFTGGALHLDGLLTSTESYGPERLVVRRREGGAPGRPTEEHIEFDQDSSFEDEVRDFGRAIAGDLRIRDGSSTDALAVMELVERTYQADATWPKSRP